MDRRITSLYNEYIHGDMSRRDFFRRVTEIAGSAAAATAAVALLEPDWAHGQQVDPEDARLSSGTVTYPGTTGPVRGYLTHPADVTGPLPGIVVIHENRGLNAHIEDVARRAALAGYVALAPDGLSFVGGGLVDQEAARDRFGQADRDTITNDVVAGVPFLAAHETCNGRIGTVGFCYGGGVSLLCAAREKAVAGSVCFYGRALSDEDVARVEVPLMMHYAGTDDRINAGIAAFRKSLDEHEIAYSLHMYPGTGHGFHNDTSQARYNEKAAGLAWRRTLRFFEETLKQT
jgi:carboxymethylenebutenolidase